MPKDELAEMSESRKLTINLEIEGVLALQDLLSRTDPKGRSEMRNHSRLYREFNQKCRDYQSKMEFKWKSGIVEWTDESAIKYLIDNLEKRIESGFSGTLSVGYTQLLDATDEYRDAQKRTKA